MLCDEFALMIQTDHGHLVVYDKIAGSPEIPNELLPFEEKESEQCLEYCISMGYYQWMGDDCHNSCISSTFDVAAPLNFESSLIESVNVTQSSSGGRRIKGCGNNNTDINATKRTATVYEVIFTVRLVVLRCFNLFFLSTQAKDGHLIVYDPIVGMPDAAHEKIPYRHDDPDQNLEAFIEMGYYVWMDAKDQQESSIMPTVNSTLTEPAVEVFPPPIAVDSADDLAWAQGSIQKLLVTSGKNKNETGVKIRIAGGANQRTEKNLSVLGWAVQLKVCVFVVRA